MEVEEGQEEVVQLTETEEKAKAQGWSPKEDWKGDPADWRDADSFLEKGEKIAAIKKERTDHMANEIRELRNLIVEQRDMAKKARLQGYKQALEEIESRQLDAVENIDKEAFKKAKEDEKRVLKQIDEESKDTGQVVSEVEVHKVFDEWKEQNEWYTKAETEDIDLFVFANSISTVIQAETGLGGKKLYDEVAKRTKKAFPHKFSNPRRTDASSVEAGGETSLKKKSGRTFDDLPSEAKRTYDRLAKQFKMAKQEFTKEEYLSSYIWD